MRRLLLGLLLLLLPLSAQAAAVAVLNAYPNNLHEGQAITLHDATVVASTGTATSLLVDQLRGGFFGLWYSCTSVTGTAAISIAWQESPTTEASDFVTVVTVDSAVAETTRLRAVNPPPMRYGRTLLTGIGSNPSDTICTVKLYGAGW